MVCRHRCRCHILLQTHFLTQTRLESGHNKYLKSILEDCVIVFACEYPYFHTYATVFVYGRMLKTGGEGKVIELMEVS